MSHSSSAAQVVVGIDAAWTRRRSSGVAAAARIGDRWRLLAAAASFDEFLTFAPAGSPTEPRSRPTDPPIEQIVHTAARLAGTPVSFVAIDMPVWNRPEPIPGRREADNAISRTFGSRGCSTHSPTHARPGLLEAEITHACKEAGFPVATAAGMGDTKALIEVYPHTALLALLGAERRIPYKAGKTTRYWPGKSIAVRKQNLLCEWSAIVNKLETHIAGVVSAIALPPQVGPETTFASLKPVEDTIDAIVCAWVGVEYIEGRALAYGDESAAVWTPATNPRHA